MNIKWTHSDGFTRKIHLDSDDNFATSLAKMQNKMAEFDGDKYFYKDEDCDKIIVDDEETFVMMLEYFQTVPANKGRIYTYQIRVDDSNKGENGSQNAGIRIDAHLDNGNILLHGINGINGPPITKNGSYSKWWNCWGIFE